MITVTTSTKDYKGIKDTTFSDVDSAIRFAKKMKREGYKILGCSCYDPEDYQTFMEAMKYDL